MPSKSLTILLWIDSAFKDATARIVRGIGLGEAFHAEGVGKVYLACPETDAAFLDANLYRLELIDNAPNSPFAAMETVLNRIRPDLLVADMAAPSRLREMKDRIPFLVLLGDSFSESLFFADLVLLPGLIPPPDFEALGLLPSVLDKTLHGFEYLHLPSAYYTTDRPPLADGKHRIAILLSGSCPEKPLDALMTFLASRPDWEPLFFADMPLSVLWPIQNRYPIPCFHGGSLTIKQRIATIDRVRLALAYPSLPVYELMSRGKEILFLPRHAGEEAVCQRFVPYASTGVFPCAEGLDEAALEKALNEICQGTEAGRAAHRINRGFPLGGGTHKAAREMLRRMTG